MKRIYDILRNAAFFSLLIQVAFYLFATLSGLSVAALKFDQYSLLLLCGAILAVANEVFRFRRLRLIWRFLIHYAAVVGTFMLVFIVAGKIAAKNVFVGIMLLTVIYWIVTALICFIFRPFRMEKTDFKPQYTPIYKEN